MSYLNSSIVSPYYDRVVEAGYPECDLKVTDSGKWHIIAYESAPVTSSVGWYFVVKNITHKEKTTANIRALIKANDWRTNEAIDRETEKTNKLKNERIKLEENRDQLYTDYAKKHLTKEVVQDLKDNGIDTPEQLYSRVLMERTSEHQRNNKRIFK